MRKWIAILLALAMTVTLAGCEGASELLELCGELGGLLSAISTMPLEDLEGLIPADTSGEATEAPGADTTAPKNTEQEMSFGEVKEFWLQLAGYWNNEDGRFVCFDQKDSNSLIFMEGIWDSGTRGWADFQEALPGSTEQRVKFLVYYPPVSNDLDGDLPGESVTVEVDASELKSHGRISVRMGEQGEWMQYTFAGYSEADAYPN